MLATVELMRLRGYGDLSTVEVSERAGVSRGAMLHQFPTKNDLVLETMRYLNERMLASSAARAEQARESGDPMQDIIEDAFDFFFGDYFFITLSISMSDERNEVLRSGVDPLTGPSRMRVERRWVDVLAQTGWPRDLATDVLALTFSLVRGFAVRLLIQDDRKRFSDLMQFWKRLVAEHVREVVGKRSTPAKRPTQRRRND
jgi:AcrR family transcriptional regulator